MHDLYEELPSVLGTEEIVLKTVGIDVGTATSHLTFSDVKLRRLGVALSSRYMVIERHTLYCSPIFLTPYLPNGQIDAKSLSSIIERSYKEAGFTRSDVDTGALILTGEAIKRENARAILELFSEEAGKFVCAIAGERLEAILAAYGSGAVHLSETKGLTLLNVDMGGGTTKFSLVEKGVVVETAAINVGGRLLVVGEDGRVVRLEEAAKRAAKAVGLNIQLGQKLIFDEKDMIGHALVNCIIELLNGGPISTLGKELLLTSPPKGYHHIDGIVLTGGVAEYIYDIGKPDVNDLGKIIARYLIEWLKQHPLLEQIQPVAERIRATVIGAAQYTVQVSGNTVYLSDEKLLPIRNVHIIKLPIKLIGPDWASQVYKTIAILLQREDFDEIVRGDRFALVLNWEGSSSYQELRALAEGIKNGLPQSLGEELPLILVFDKDIGKLIGSMLKDELNLPNPLISIDGIVLNDFERIDLGSPLPGSGVVPVVIKTLLFPLAQKDS